MHAHAFPALRGAVPRLAPPACLLAVMAAALWLLDRIAPGGGAAAMLPALAGMAAGCAALAWVRPQRAGLSPPHVMLALGFVGMLLGLLVDIAHAGPAQLDALCGQAVTRGFAEALALHLAYLPGMHAGMLAGGLLAIPSLRLMRPHCGRYLCALFAQNLLCSAWMLVGMTAGALWLARWQPLAGGGTLPGMLGGMFVGMTWGMVASVALYRGFYTWRDRRARRAAAH